MTTRSATELRREISRSEDLVRELEASIAELEQQRLALLADLPAPGDFTPAAGRRREGLEQVESDLAEARLEGCQTVDRIEVLRAQLPSPREVAAAEARSADLAAEAEEIAEQAVAEWDIVSHAVAALEQAVALYSETRRRWRATRDERSGLEERFGLEVSPRPNLAPGREGLVVTRDQLLVTARSITQPQPAATG